MRSRFPALLASFAFGVSKHAFATIIVAAGITILCMAVYVGLLIVAIVMNEGLGGPLTPIVLPIMAIALSLLVAVLGFAPATMIAERLCGSATPLRIALQIPVSCAVLFAELLALHAFDVGEASVGFLLLAIPLGAYWWTLKSAEGVRALAKTVVRAVSGRA